MSGLLYSRAAMVHESEPVMLTEYDFSELLNVDVTTVRRWRRRGEGPPYLKMGACVRYELAAVRAFIDASRRKAGAA